MNKNDKEEIIKTKELPVISFCVICDKPIYIGEEYEDIEYYDDASKDKINKKHMSHGNAHVHCIKEKEIEIAELKEEHKKKKNLWLALSIVAGFTVALSLMLILLFLSKLPIYLSIIIPLVSGYALMSDIYILSIDEVVGPIFVKVGKYLALFPKSFYQSMDDDTGVILFLKIVLLVLLSILDYIALLILIVLSTIISIFVFPFVIFRKEK